MKKKKVIEDTIDYKIKLDEEISLKLLLYSQYFQITIPDIIRLSIRKFFGIEEPTDEPVKPVKKKSTKK